MKKNKWFIKLGYILALLCFILNFFIIITHLLNDEGIGVPIFLGLGGVLLLITSICKYGVDRRK